MQLLSPSRRRIARSAREPRPRRAPSSSRAGTALATAVVLILALSAIVGGLFSLTTAEYTKSRRWRDETRAFYLAEAGLNEAYATLVSEGRDALADLDYPRALGRGSYTVDVTLGEDDPELPRDRIRFRAFGREGHMQAGIEVVARSIPNGSYQFGAFGDERVVLGPNARVDSFDSSLGPYAVAGAEGRLGSVGSNGDVEVRARAEVAGDVVPGPDGFLRDAGPSVSIAGATASAGSAVLLAPVLVPEIPETGALTVDGARTLGPGEVHLSALTVLANGELTIQGPATVVVDDLTLRANASLVIDGASGGVALYGTGDFELLRGSRVTTTSARARDVALYLSGDTGASPPASIELRARAELAGTIYAPHADLALGTSFELFGAVVADAVELERGARLHFDEDLLYLEGVEPDYEQLSWLVIPTQEL